MKRNLLPSLAVLLSLTGGAVLAQSVAPAPSLLNFQGRLAKPDGTPVVDGTYSVRFSLWDAASGGAEKWNQTIGAVTVKNGVFATLLNVGTGPADLFNTNLFLEIKIGSDAALTPRQQLVSVAYSLKANTVPDSAITTPKIADSAVTNAKVGGNAIDSGKLASDAASLNKITGGALSLTGNRLFVNGGTIQQGGSALSTTTDLGLYSLNPTQWLRLVTNNGNIQFFTDGGIGTTPRMTLSAAGDVGIGIAPGYKLDVNGTARLTGLRLTGNGAAAGNVLTSDANGNASWQTSLWQANGSNLFYNGGNVSIGSSAAYVPTFASRLLSLRGDAAAAQFPGSSGIALEHPDTTSNWYLLQTSDKNFNIFRNSQRVFGITAAGETQVKTLQILGGSDVAEPFNVREDSAVQPGMVVSIDPNKVGELRLSSKAYDRTVAGIVSGAGGVSPGMTLTQTGTSADGKHPVALSGRVWCWCDADASGPIAPGDLLTTSNTPGHAMRAANTGKAMGAVLGKAMSSLPHGKGLVLVLVNLQ